MQNGTEKTVGERKGVESRIPKSARFSCAKEIRSKTSLQTKEVRRWKAAAEKITTYASKATQTTNSDVQNNVKPMSIEKISKDVMNHLESKRLESNTYTKENVSPIPSTSGTVSLQENSKTTKQTNVAQSKGNCPTEQTSQKNPSSISRKTSSSDLKSSAFGGMRLVSKRNACVKRDIFPSITDESKGDDHEAHSTESSSKELKTTPNSSQKVLKKETEPIKDENTEQPEAEEAEQVKSPLALKEVNLNMTIGFGGMRFTPKRKSTHQKPDLFENIQKESNINFQQLHSTESATIEKQTTPDSAMAVKKQNGCPRDENLEPFRTEKKESLEISLADGEAGPKTSTPFEGWRFKQTTHLINDVFKKALKEPKNYPKVSPTDLASKELKRPDFPKAIKKPEIRNSNDEKLKQLPTRPNPSKQQIPQNAKEAGPAPGSAFGGIPFKPKQKNKRDLFAHLKS